MAANIRTGLFFGSFNPIHTGHMILAHYFTEFTDIQEVWFVVSPHNPLKMKQTLLPDHHRLALVKEAIQDDARFKACDIEFHMPQPSYTVHTLAYLQEKYPSRSFVLLMGSDILPSFHKWKNYTHILENYLLYVYPRPGQWENPYTGHPHIHIIENVPQIEISSTFIREAIQSGKDVKYLVPDPVYNYIREMHFYK